MPISIPSPAPRVLAWPSRRVRPGPELSLSPQGCDIKTDYAPLLHTLAEFGWLLTSVLPTPILRHDR